MKPDRLLTYASARMRDDLRCICEVSSAMHIPAYLVGGVVRDMILKRRPEDLDVVVQGNGIAFAESLADALSAQIIRHRHFQTATLVCPDGQTIDIATARKEHYPHPAALPVVQPSTIHEDLLRRDFTINAMAMDLGPDRFGTLIDVAHGLQDLSRGLVRVLHDKSFIDDPTRIIRGVRFAQRFGFRIEKETLILLRDALQRNCFEKTQPHRIRDELILALAEPDPARVVAALAQLAGLHFVHPQLQLNSRVLRGMKRVRAVLDWYANACRDRQQPDPGLVYACVLLQELDARAISLLVRKFAMHRHMAKALEGFARAKRELPHQLRSSRCASSHIFAAASGYSVEIVLACIVIEQGCACAPHIKKYLRVLQGVRTHVRGEDLHRLGIPRGPRYQEILRRVLDARLDGVVETKEDELRLVKEIERI